MSVRKNNFSENNIILFIYLLFTIIFFITWIYELFISKKYGMGIVVTFWEAIFTVSYIFFVKE